MTLPDFSFADACPVSDDIIARTYRAAVEPVEGGASPFGAVFRLKGYEVFVCRRWEKRNGGFVCVIDFAAPMTGYVAQREGAALLRLMRNDEGQKIALLPEHEEALFLFFTSIVDSDIRMLQKTYAAHFHVEFIRFKTMESLCCGKTPSESKALRKVA